MTTINLPFDIEIELGDETKNLDQPMVIRSGLKTDCPHCSQPSCFFDCDESQAEDSIESETEARERLEKNRAYDGIESLILALAAAGVDVESPAFLEGIEEAVEAVENNI